ncbi:hypothetical protein D3C78_1167110 [compost metagenome]
MLNVALGIHLAFFPLGWCRQGDNPEHPRADSLGNGLDGATLAGAITALEDHADFQTLGYNPLLQLDQLDVQVLELLIVILTREPLYAVFFVLLLFGHALSPRD